jgi:glycosyltransferase involved in cell wall biosynthesis
MPIKTLHLTNAFNAHSGGISTFYLAMLQTANQQKREMRLIVPASEDRVELVGDYGKIYYVRGPKAPIGGDYRWLPPTTFLYPSTTIRSILRQERPDVIEISEKYSLVYLGGTWRIGLLRDLDFRPLILGLSCERMDENVAAYVGTSMLHRWFCRWYMRWIYFPFFDHHIAVSRHAAEELVASSYQHAVERGIWIRPMGVDAARFSPSRRSADIRCYLLQQANAQPGAKLLLYAGRLAPEKNLPLLIEMMRCLADTDCRLILVGDGVEREQLKRLAGAQAAGRVCFLGHIAERERLAEVYASCDLFVHPNPREPFGIAPLEAMAAGLPLVGANCGGITSYANQSNAWLAAPEPAAFASAVRQALADDDERQARIRAGLETAAAHNWDRAAEAYFDLYDALHTQFQGRQALGGFSPYAVSTPAASSADRVIAVSSSMAQAFFHALMHLQIPGKAVAQKTLAPRYMRMVPSVTVNDENQRTFCVQEGQT